MFRLRMLPVALLLGLLLAFSVAAACEGGAAEPPGSRIDTPSTPALSPAEPTQPSGPTVPVPTATETPILNRQNCGAISGTAYTSEQERRWYLGNCITPTATLAPTATPAGCGALQNPWGYDFCPGGTRIYSPPSDFCSYFACFPNFWNGRGHVMQCRDGMFGKSGGIQGSCSYHGGNNRALLSY